MHRLTVVLSLAAILGVAEAHAQRPSFRVAEESVVGVRFGGPISVATGDFNGDGIADLAVGTYEGAAIQVVLGVGDGTFRQYRSVALGANVRQISLADFDGDGNLDAVAICSNPNIAVVLRGNGDGTFEKPLRLDLPSPGLAVLAADLDGDGIPDLAIGQEQGISVALGKGDLTFGPATQIPFGAMPVAIRLADLNGDGIADLAIAGTDAVNFGVGSVTVLLGSGGGGFRILPLVPVGRPSDLAIGDFNNDQKPDIAVAGRYDSKYYIALGNGDGTLGPIRTVAMEEAPLSVAAADFNGDGLTDLVLGNYYGGKIAILLSSGDGTFRRAPDIQAKGDTYSVAVADLNGDGLADVAAANHSSQTVAVAWARGDGLFEPAFHLGSTPVWIAASAGSDGLPLLAVANSLADSLVVFRGGLQQFDTYPAGLTPARVAFGDFNGDSIPDLAAVNSESGDLSILMGSGDGKFQQPVRFAVGRNPIAMAVLDINRDGLADLAVTLAGDDGVLLLNLGNGQFAVNTIPGIAAVRSIAVADFNLDGIPDLAASGPLGGSVRVLLAKDGLLQPAGSLELEGISGDVLAADINGDGKPDIVANVGIGLYVFLGKGDGSFETPKSLEGPPPGTGTYGAMTAGDFDGDGRLDLAVVNSRGVILFYGNGDGTFRSPLPLGVDTQPQLIIASDWNQDGRVDLLTVNRIAGTVSVLTNQR